MYIEVDSLSMLVHYGFYIYKVECRIVKDIFFCSASDISGIFPNFYKLFCLVFISVCIQVEYLLFLQLYGAFYINSLSYKYTMSPSTPFNNETVSQRPKMAARDAVLSCPLTTSIDTVHVNLHSQQPLLPCPSSVG